MADTDRSRLPQEALVTEIEKTRLELARTIDAISDRVSPTRVAQRTTAQVRERASRIDPLLGGVVALAAVAVAGFWAWRRLKR